MFLNVDSFKKKQLSFNQADDYFTIDGVRKQFVDVTAFYRSSTEHFTNQVYQGNSLSVMLQFVDAQQLEIYEVDSNHREHYQLLHRVTNAIEVFRRELLLNRYRNGEEISFSVNSEQKLFRLNGTMLFFGDELVKSLVIDDNSKQPQLEMVLSDYSQFVKPSTISDSALFIELVLTILPTTYKQPSKAEKYLPRLFVCSVVLFGINGWLGLGIGYGLLMDHRLVEIFSFGASFILAIWLILRPFFWLVHRSNGKRIEQRLRRLEADGCEE